MSLTSTFLQVNNPPSFSAVRELAALESAPPGGVVQTVAPAVFAILPGPHEDEAGQVVNLHPITYAIHATPYRLHPTPYTLHPAFYTPHPTTYNLHPAPYTLHPTPYTLHPTPFNRL